MTDLFDSMAEHAEERAAIMADSGINDPEALRADLHRCEVATVIRWFYPHEDDSEEVRKTKQKGVVEYFDLVEKKRGKEAADALRADCRIAWKEKACAR